MPKRETSKTMRGRRNEIQINDRKNRRYMFMYLMYFWSTWYGSWYYSRNITTRNQCAINYNLN